MSPGQELELTRIGKENRPKQLSTKGQQKLFGEEEP